MSLSPADRRKRHFSQRPSAVEGQYTHLVTGNRKFPIHGNEKLHTDPQGAASARLSSRVVHSEGYGVSGGTLNLSFTGGKGVSGLMALSTDVPREIALDLTRKNMDAIEAVHRLEQDVDSEARFEEAATALTRAYEAW